MNFFSMFEVKMKRDLESFSKGLSDEQITEKRRLLKECAKDFPDVTEWLAEIACDFVVRNPDEATRIRESREWENTKSMHDPQKLAERCI